MPGERQGSWRNPVIGVLVLLLLGALLLHLHGTRPTGHAQVLQVVGGDWRRDDAPGQWRPVRLPHDWLNEADAGTLAWYRVQVPMASQPLALWAMYLPTVHLNVEVYLNGQIVGDGGRVDDPVARLYPRPLYFPLTPELFSPGDNEIHLRVLTDPPGTGLLTEFYLGPDDVLLPYFERRLLLKATMPTAFVVTLLILATLLASVTLRRPQETEYAWNAAIIVALVCFALPTLVTNIPVPTRLWDWFRSVSVGWAVVFITIFIHRFLCLHRPRLERWVAGVFAASSIAVLLVPGDVYYRLVAVPWSAMCLLWGLYPTWVMSRAVLRRPNVEYSLMMMAGLSLLITGGHDALMMARVLPRWDGFLMQYATPLAALLFTWILLSRFIVARGEAELLNRELEQRVRDKAAEIERNYARMRELEGQSLLAEERQRIMRDMHDGLGGHLTGALALLERGESALPELEATLRAATEDLRLVIHSFQPRAEDLGMVLGVLRPRLQAQVDAAGLKLRWQPHDTNPVAGLGPQMALQILRIVQEAVTNAVRHSGGSEIRVTLRDGANGEVWLEVADDGRGLPAKRGEGFGLANMQARATAIGARLELLDAGPGLQLRLSLPAAQPDKS